MELRILERDKNDYIVQIKRWYGWKTLRRSLLREHYDSYDEAKAFVDEYFQRDEMVHVGEIVGHFHSQYTTRR
jgi:hypothetical protein